MLPRRKQSVSVALDVHATGAQNVDTYKFEATDTIRMDSSNLLEASYDDTHKLLRIQFTNGSVYEYRAVPRPIFDMLATAPSPGMYFAASIKRRYGFVRL